MMHEIVLLPHGVLMSQREPRFAPETGVAIFPVHVAKAGDIAISADIMIPNLQQGATTPKTHMIGEGGGLIQLKVRPGAMQFQSMITKKKDELGEQVEFELGEQIKLIPQFGNSD